MMTLEDHSVDALFDCEDDSSDDEGVQTTTNQKKLAFWKKKLDDTIYKNGIRVLNNGVHLTKVIDVLKEAKEDNCAINVDEFLTENDKYNNMGMNLLNSILHYTRFEHGEEDMDNLEFLLLQSANWKTYVGTDLNNDTIIESPLMHIAYCDEEAAIKILPFFKAHGHIIDNRERKILSKKVLDEWDRLNNSSSNGATKKRKAEKQGPRTRLSQLVRENEELKNHVTLLEENAKLLEYKLGAKEKEIEDLNDRLSKTQTAFI